MTTTAAPAPADPILIVSTIGGDLMLAPDVLGGMLYFTTACCAASGKGSANAASGVVCRRCYREVHDRYGWAGLIYDDESIVGTLTSMLTDILTDGTPGPDSVSSIRRDFAAPMARRALERAHELCPRTTTQEA